MRWRKSEEVRVKDQDRNRGEVRKGKGKGRRIVKSEGLLNAVLREGEGNAGKQTVKLSFRPCRLAQCGELPEELVAPFRWIWFRLFRLVFQGHGEVRSII
jgi:hypothetical protein